MNLLDRHILKSVFFSCAAAVLMFTFILVVGSVVRDLVGNVLAGQLPLLKFVELTLMTAPYVASYALPLGMLTGVLLTLGRLSSDSEITAMRAAGISMVRIARPVLLLGAVGAALALWINFQSMPKAKVRYEHELTETLRANPIGFIVPKTFIREFPGWILYIGDKQKGILRDFWAWQLDSDRRVVHFIHAASGHMNFDEAADDLVVTLANGQAEDLNDRNPEDFSAAPPVATFEVSEPFRLSLAAIFGHSADRKKLNWMTYAELHSPEAVKTALKDTAGNVARAEMKVALTIQEKYTTALAVLTFTLIGVPLGIKVSRRETSANLGVAVLLALGYYFLTVMVSWLDRHPGYRPDLLIWLPNLILVWLAIGLFRRLRAL